MPSFTNVIDIDLTEATSDYKVECHKAVHQWDQGVVLHFTGVTIPEGSVCQFDGRTTTYNQLVDASEATTEIPNLALGGDLKGDLKAHLYVETENYGIVIYDLHIPVIRRVMPSSYVYEDNVQTLTDLIESLLPAIPTPTINDAGKILGVNDSGVFALVEGGGGSSLPSYTTSDAGKILWINSSGTGLEWDYPFSEIPVYTSTDAGKVLSVNSGGTATEWKTVSGGGMTAELLASKTNYNLQSGAGTITLLHPYDDYSALGFVVKYNGNNQIYQSILLTSGISDGQYAENMVRTNASQVNAFKFSYPSDKVSCGFSGTAGTATTLEIYGIK